MGIGIVGISTVVAALAAKSEQAAKAVAQLNAAYKSTGDTLGLTRSRLDDLAAQIQRTTTVSGDLVKQGEAILLTFDKVRGQAFERTLRVATDLSARLGTDLESAIKSVGTALQDPISGLITLRRAGIQFTDEQKGLIRGFVETNQAAKAQNVILFELERRFGGSAAAARSTLGGALTGLSNAFSSLFEVSRESTAGTVEAINSLSEALNKPETKRGFDFLISSLAKVLDLSVRGASKLGELQTKLLELAKTRGPTASAIRGLIAGSNPLLAQLALFAENEANAVDTRTRGPTGIARGRGNRPGIDTGGAVAELEEINITVRKIVDQNRDVLRELEESTRTSVERVSADYSKLKATLQTLLDEGLITTEQFNERIGAGITEVLGLEEFDLNEIKAKYITLKTATTELGEFMKGVWQGVGRSIQATLSDAIFEWRLSWKSLLDIARRALADISSAIITSGIKKALTSQLSSSATGAGFLSLFGLAGGGAFDGARVVGEDGPELVTGRGRVTNARQMAFAGMGGAKVSYSPTFNLNIQSSGDEESERRMAEYVESRLAQSQGEFVRLLGRSGVEVKG